MTQRRISTLIMLFTLLSCAGSRDQSVRTLAQQIGKAENQLKNRTVAVMPPNSGGKATK